MRAYDGLFSITKEYESDSIGRESRGRWLYRGYNVGGNLVGRWRDTHTPQDLNGYEGTFLVSSLALAFPSTSADSLLADDQARLSVTGLGLHAEEGYVYNTTFVSAV